MAPLEVTTFLFFLPRPTAIHIILNQVDNRRIQVHVSRILLLIFWYSFVRAICWLRSHSFLLLYTSTFLSFQVQCFVEGFPGPASIKHLTKIVPLFDSALVVLLPLMPNCAEHIGGLAVASRSASFLHITNSRAWPSQPAARTGVGGGRDSDLTIGGEGSDSGGAWGRCETAAVYCERRWRS
jgi:hypothetical protein